MKSIKLFFLFLITFTSVSFGANISSTGTGGNWNNPASWVGNTVPTATDDVTIVPGATITLNDNITILSLTINGNFVIGNDVTARSITVTGTTSISGTGAFTVGNFDITHSITLQGALTNNGTLDLYNSSSQVANIIFNANSPFTIGGSNTPQFNNVTFTNGTITAAVTFDVNGSVIIENGATFANGNLTHNVAGNWTENGTGQMTGSGTINMDAPLIQSITNAATFFNLTYNGGGIGVIGANIIVTNDFNIANNTEVKTSQTNTFQANFNIANGSKFNATAGTSIFNSTSSQTITIGVTDGTSNVEFWNAYFDNGGNGNPKTISGDMISRGLTYIYNDAVLNDAGNNHTLYGSFRIDGTCNFSGTITAKGGRFYDDGGDGDFTLGTADLICQYLFVGSNDIMRVNGNVSVGIEDNADYNYIVIDNGSQLIGTAGKTLLVKNNKTLYIRGANNFPTGFGTTTLEELSFVRYDQNIDQTINNNVIYGNLYLNNNQSDGAKIKTAAGGLTVMGNIYIYNHSTLALQNFNHHFKGHIVNTDDVNGNGSITTTGGTVFLDAADKNQYIYDAGSGSYSFNNLTITNTAPTTIRYKRFYNNIIINGNFTATNTGGSNSNRLNIDMYENLITGSGTSSFNLGENVWLFNSGENNFETSIGSFGNTKTFNVNSTVRFNRITNGSHQNIPGGFIYGNIELFGTNEKLPQANLDVNGNFSRIGETPLLKDNTHSINVAGDWNMNQTYTDLTGSNNVIFDGNNQNISNSNFSYVYFTNSGIKTISGSLDILNNLVIRDGVTVNAGNNNINISGNWDEQNGQYTQTGGYVIFDGATANQTVNSQANSYFYNFQINKTGANKLVTLNSNIDVNGSFDFEENNAQLNLNGKDLHIARNFFYRGGCSFTHNNGKVFFDGSEGTYQLIRNYNTNTIVFYNVEFSGTLVKRLYDNSFRFQGDVFINNTTLDGQYWDHYVEGNWTNTGIFRHSNTMHFDGTSNQNITASSFHSVRFGGGANTKTLTGDINLTGNLWIDNATLDVGAGNNNITLDDYWHNDSTGTFNPRQGTVTLTGEYNRIFTGATNTLYGTSGQVITKGGAKDFYNLVINATNKDYWMFIHGNLKVLNDFKIIKGRFYQSYDPDQYGINDIYVGGDFINLGSMYQNNYGEKLELNPSAGTHIFNPGSSNTYSITNFNGAVGTSYTFESNLSLYNNRAITISNCDLDLNSNKITTNGAAGNITMNGGSLEVDSSAIISIGNGATFTNTGGIFKLIGHADNPASLIATTGNFTFVQTAGTIHAQNYRIQGTSGNGIDIQGGNIDETNTFQNGSFSAGIGNSYLKTTNIDLGSDRNITEVTFNAGPTYNVERTAGNGAMNFENSTGTLAGENFDNDDANPGSKINWAYPGAAFWDGGGDGTHWNDAANWVGDVIPNSSSIVILDHGIVTGAYTVSISTIADGLAKSISINSNGTQIELNLNGQKLFVEEDITIGAASVLTQTNVGDEITLGGSWSNAGTYNEGTSSVIFNPTTGTHTITTQGIGDSFYNLTINGTGGTNVISSAIDVNGNVNIQAGTLNAGNNTITVAGNWTRTGGSVFNFGTSTVNFDGNNQNINGGEFYNFITGNSGTKTATANIDINNDITINAGTVFDGGTNIIYVGDDWTNNVGNTGFTQNGTGTVIFDGTISTQDISKLQPTSFNNIIISGTQTKYTKNNITINGNLIINNAALYISVGTTIDGIGTSNTLNMSLGRIYVNGANNFPQNFETINLSGGTVDYYANIDQTIYPTTYYNLMLRRINSGNQTTKTITGDITVNGSLNIYDNETLLDVDEHTINLSGNLSLATGGRQINWGTNGTLIHFGGSWIVDQDIDFLNNVIKKNTGQMRVAYKSLEIKGNLSILEDTYLRQDTVNITCTGANKTFTLSATAYVRSYNPETIGASSGRKAFPIGFANYNLHKDSRVYISGTVGDQEIYTIPNYGNLFLYTNAEINIKIDGNLDVEGNLLMANEPTLVDDGHNINIAGATIDIRKYSPSGTSTITFDGTDQRIYDAGLGTTVFNMNNVIFAGSGQKSLYYSADDWYNVAGNLIINNGVTVYLPRRLDFSGANWLNNGIFNNTTYTISFNGTVAQTIDPGANNNFYSVKFLNAGSKTFINNGINVNNGTFTIEGSTTVDMATGLTHYIASERINKSNGSTWTTENANFIFDRNGTQYIPQMTCKNLTFRRYDQWNRIRFLEGAISINDLNIEEGTQLRCSQNAETTTATYNVTMTGNFINDGILYAWGNIFAFESDDTTAKTIKQGGGSFHNVTFNQNILSQSARAYNLTEETHFFEDLTIGRNASLNLNGQILRLGNDDPNDPVEPNAEQHIIQTDGTLNVNEGASLIFSCRDQGNPTLNVDGTLKIVGTNGNNATITSTDWYSNTHRIDININSGGTIFAQYYLMKYLSNEGLFIDANAHINTTDNFSNGTWSDLNTGGGRYLWCNANLSAIGTIDNVTFNYSGTPTVGTHFNVKRDAGSTGVLTFNGTSSGLLAGKTYEADEIAENNTTTSLIEWPIPSEVTWIGAVSSDWFNANNWSPTTVPTNLTDAIIPIKNNNPIIFNAGAQCKDLKITNGNLKLAPSNDLAVNGDVYIGSGNDVGILAIEDAGCSISVNGNWTRSQNSLFVHGNGTVTFNAGGGSISIDPRDSEFGNITFNGGATFLLNRSLIKVDNDFTISNGTVQSIVNNYNLHIKGNYNNSGGLFDNTTHGTVHFDGINNQLVTNADLWNVIIDGSANKTTSGTSVINGNLTVKNGTFVGGNAIDMNNNVTIEATGGFDDGGFTHTFSGYLWTGTGAYNGSGIIEFDRVSSQFIAASKFNSLLLKNNGGVTLQGDVNMTGNLSLIAPNTYINVENYQLTNTSAGTGTFSMADARRIYVRGANNFPAGFNSYNFNKNSFTMYDGTMPQTIAPVPVVYGKVYLNNSAKTAGGNLDINGLLYFYENTSLDVTNNNYRINIEGNWYNQFGASFIPHEGEVIFDGNEPISYMFIYEESKNTNPFYKLTVNKAAGNVTSNWTDITVQNNMRVINGQMSTNKTMYIGGDMSALSGTFATAGTYYLNKASGSSNLQLNNSTLNNLTINSGAIYTLQDELKMNGNFNLISGTFDGNGQLVRMGNYGEANEISGLYKIGEGGTLQLPNYGIFKVNSGGEVDVVGALNSIATVTNYNNGRYYFNIESGGTIKARNYLFEYMEENGIYVKSGGIIDNNYNFSFGTFTNSANGGTCLRIENIQNFTEAGGNPILEVSFPNNPNGGASNVTKTIANVGTIDFKDYSGEFAGENYDNDPSNLLNWIPQPFVMWTGNTNSDWYKTGNWELSSGPNRIPLISDNVIIPKRTNQPIIKHDGALAKTLDVQQSAILTLSTATATVKTLVVAQDINFNGTIIMSSVNDTLTVGGNWKNSGVFTPGQGTVIFNSPFGIKTIDNRLDFFNNLYINTSSSVQLSNNNTINGNFIIKQGTFDLTSNIRFTVKGNFLNYGNFITQNGKLVLAGSNTTQIFNPGNSNYYNIDIDANSGTTVNLTNNLNLTHNMNVNTGTFDLNNNTFNMGDGSGTDALTINGGIFNIGGNAYLKPAKNSSIEVHNGGIFKIVGMNSNNPAYLQSQSGSYGFNVNSGATIYANFYSIKNTNANGIRIKAGAIIDGTDNFSNGTWQNGQSLGQYLWLENNFSDFTAKDVYFHNGASINVKRISGTGVITFEDALGLLAGSNFEEDIPANGDDTGNIHWTNTHETYTWTGATDTNWNVATNWDVPMGHAVPNSLAIALIPDVSNASGNFPILGVASGDADGTCYDLKVEDGASLTIQNSKNLDVDNSVTIYTGATFTVSPGSVSNINVADTWSVVGTFNHGNSSTVILDATDGKVVTISGNNSFNNLKIETTGNAEYLTGAPFKMEGYFDIASGTFTVQNVTDTISVKGNFSNTGTFKHGNSTIILNGNTQNISNTGTGNFYNLTCAGSDNKTISSNLTIENDIEINSGTTLNVGSNTLTLLGDWVNSGTFNAATSLVKFEGSSTQLINNNNKESFYNLTINNSASTNPQIILSGNIDVTGSTWTMTDGIIETTSGKMLTINSSVSLVGGNTGASFVSGPVTKIGNQNFTFPIGKGSKFARLGISGLSNTANFVAEYFEKPYSDITNLGSGLDHVSGYEHWTLNRTVGTGEPYVTFYWEDGAQSGIDNLASLTTANYTGGEWENRLNGSTNGTLLVGSITSGTTFDSFGPCGFASTDSNNPLNGINQWTGNVSIVWNNIDNWTIGVPTAGTDAHIPALQADKHQPTININAEAKDLTIDVNASLTINPLKSLTTEGSLIINGSLLLKSDNTGNASLINKMPITYGDNCDVKEELYLTGFKFHYLSTSMVTTNPDRFKSDPVAPYYNHNFFYYDETDINENWTAGWHEYSDPIMTLGDGYAVYYDSSPTVTLDRSTSGNFNSADINKSLTYTGGSAAPLIHRGWNFVGNPFPAHLDWDNPNWTKNNIYNSVYFWNGTGYSYYVGTDGDDPNVGGIKVNGASKNIPPLQGFFVKVKEGADPLQNQTGSITMPLDARTTGHHAYWKSNLRNEIDIIRINVSGNDKNDETAIRFVDGSTSQIDADYDAFKLFPDSWYGMPQIYSITSEGVNAAINSLPGYYDELIIPVGFQTPASGAFTIDIPAFSLDRSTKMYFEDTYTNEVYDMTNGLNFNFNSEEGEFNNRFKILFSVTTDVKEVNDDAKPNVNIYSSGTGIYLKSQTNDAILGNVQVVNISGSVVYNSNNTKEGLARINFSKYPAGTYIVKLTNKYGVYVGKVFIAKE